MADDKRFNTTPDKTEDQTDDDTATPVSSEGEGSTAGMSNPDLHGAARDVAENAGNSDGDNAAKTAGG